MKPGKINWASNTNYAAGPEIGNPTKVPPVTGRIADGWEPDEPPPAAWWNFLTWAINSRIDYLSGIRFKNILAKTNGTPGAPVFGAGAVVYINGVHRPIAAASGSYPDYHHVEVYDTNAATGSGIASTNGGEIFNAGATSLPAGSQINSGTMVSDSNGNAAIGVNNVANGLYFSTAAAPLAWNAWAGTAGDNFNAVARNNIDGIWILVDQANTRIETTSTLGAATAVRKTDASFTGLYNNILYTNHAPGTLYPDDPGNKVGLAFGYTGAVWHRSVDQFCTIWSTLTPAPFSPSAAGLDSLAYSYLGSRFGVICTNGPGTARPTFAYSDDNGDNWVEIVDAFGLVARGYQAWSIGTDESHLMCDGWGHWIAVLNANDGVTEQVLIFGSLDNGLTWERIYWPGSEITIAGTGMRIATWYGDGAFWFVHAGWNGAASVMQYMASLRVSE